MDQGDFLRHRVRPEWGIGQVMRRADDRIDVQFAHGLIPLRLTIAAAFLEKVSRSEAAAAKAAAGAKRDGPASTAGAPRRAPRKKKAAVKEEADEAE